MLFCAICRGVVGRELTRSGLTKTGAAYRSRRTFLPCGEAVVAPSGFSGAQFETTCIISDVFSGQAPPLEVPTPDEAIRLLLRSGSSYDSVIVGLLQ